MLVHVDDGKIERKERVFSSTFFILHKIYKVYMVGKTLMSFAYEGKRGWDVNLKDMDCGDDAYLKIMNHDIT